MTTKILLDPEGDLSAPTGVQVVENEVDFLRLALLQSPLLIRGTRLCAWAEAFYALRGLPVQVVESPVSVLRRVFPALSSEQAQQLARKIGKEHLSEEEMSPTFVLNACFSDDYALWQENPSPQQAARWLLWLLKNHPNEAEMVVLRKFAEEMQCRAANTPLVELYRAQNAEQAQILLFRWLGAEKKEQPAWGEFPLELPSSLLAQIKEAWMKRIIATKGNFFSEMLSFPLSLSLRQELAILTAEYYRQNAHKLSRAVLQQLYRYLDQQSLSALEEIIPPPEPSSLPEGEKAVLEWFEHQYLPYRRWQAAFGDDFARQTIITRAQDFARWLLAHYPRWLLSGDYLVFQKSARLETSNALTLCILLDGLPAWDAEKMVREISAHIPRLTLLQKTYCFTALPTVTEFAKEALLKGVPPRYAPQAQMLGYILPDKCPPHKHLKEAQHGQVWFWRVEQPDKAYHFEQEDKCDRQVRAELQVIVDEIQKLVDTIPEIIHLNILLTSDHGRLMNPHTPRQSQPGPGMKTHGRAAWGKVERTFPENGFVINENAGWVELFGERFGVEHDLCLAWNEITFSNISGTDAYPHGGLFPEEVIVPWFIFERDAQLPKLEIKVTGKGEAEMSGEVAIEIINNSPLKLECQKVTFSHGAELPDVNWEIAPLNQFTTKATLTPWPNKSKASNLTVTFMFVQPNGAVFIQPLEAVLQVETLYERSDDDLLKDLNL
ncbi:MAG: hypothetical protein ABWK53_07770 [Anaerolineales bacterium]